MRSRIASFFFRIVRAPTALRFRSFAVKLQCVGGKISRHTSSQMAAEPLLNYVRFSGATAAVTSASPATAICVHPKFIVSRRRALLQRP